MRNDKRLSQSNRRLSTRLFWQLILALCAYTVSGVFFYFVARNLYNLYIWQGNELIYRLVHWLDMRADVVALLYLMTGYVAIFLHYWRQPFRYIEQIAQATEQVVRADDELIVLPGSLQEFELKMNQLKLKLRDNERAAREAEQRKNDLVVYLAHDLKTPLTSVIGYLTLLRDETEISEGLRQKYLSISLDKAERLEDLINEFFEITRFNLSTLTLEPSRVNLTRLLEQLVYEFKPMLDEKQLSCTLDAGHELTITCDVDKMQRVFDNLLRNAVAYSFPGSPISIQAEQGPGGVTVRFTNHGNTIAPDKLERIFEQFFRLDASRASSSGGAGLGLAIAKQIVELHGGRLSASSADETICFTLQLPSSPGASVRKS